MNCAEITAAAEQLGGDQTAVGALPRLFEVLQRTEQFSYTQESGGRLIRTVEQAIARIPLSACLSLVDAGRWVEWPAWDKDEVLSRDASELCALLRHPQPEVVLRAATDLGRLAPTLAARECDRLFASQDPAERLCASIAAARLPEGQGEWSGRIANQLQSPDANARYWAIWSLGERLPGSFEFVLAALGHADSAVREEAIARLEAGLDPQRFAVPLPEAFSAAYLRREPAGDWREQALFGALHTNNAQQAIARAVHDASELVRQTACMLLTKLGFASTAARAALIQARSSADPATCFWAGVALDRIDKPRWNSFRRLVESSSEPLHEGFGDSYSADGIRTRMSAANAFQVDLDDFGFHVLTGEPDDDRYEAVRVLARHEGADLVAAADRGEISAIATLDLAEEIIQSHVCTLLSVATENTFDAEVAVERLARIGPAAVDLLCAAWLGSTVYFGGGHAEVAMDTIGPCLAKMGNAAIPALSFGLERPSLGLRCGDYLSQHGAAAALAAPAWLWAWRAPQGSDGILGSGSGWDSRGRHSEDDWMGIVCSRMGAGSQALLQRAVQSPLSILRERACHAWRWQKALERPELDRLRAAWADSQPRVRIAAAQALVDCKQADKELRLEASELLHNLDRE